LYSEGFIQQIWFRGDAPVACMIVEGRSVDEVAEKLKLPPLVQAGLLDAPMIIPLKPYPGFATSVWLTI